jgi:hypothetical protein
MQGSRAFTLAVIALVIIPLNFAVLQLATGSSSDADAWLTVFSVLALVQFVLGVIAIMYGVQARREDGTGTGGIVLGVIATIGAPLGWFVGILGAALGSLGGAWGRPLRIRGKQLHCGLREGSDWTRGRRPDPSALDEPTRRALEALWLHDAQKEHASVPAFSRVSWMLASVGAPAELLAWCHRAALEEIEHTRLCFALAAGYAGRSHSVQPMPELLAGLGEIDGDPLIVLATESLADGCQLEDFNADVAAECASVCREPATREVLHTIAIEERSHAEFSWAVLGWLLEQHGDRVRPALHAALAKLHTYRRPTAVAWDKKRLVVAADPQLLREHGRLPDERWAELWQQRLRHTEARLGSMRPPATIRRAPSATVISSPPSPAP